jgi:hypothetical protein
MAERKGLSKKIRFEVFKRDSFTCQYCGKSAPEVVLEVDHIKPVSKDGENDIVNLITACKACNAGKSDRELSDDTVMAKRKAQLDELQERREQIEMMMEWQVGLESLKEIELENLVTIANSKISPIILNEHGISKIRICFPKFTYQEIYDCIQISASQYLEYEKGGKYFTQASISKFLDYIPKIAKSRRIIAKKPYLGDLFRLKGYMKSKGFYVGYNAMDILEDAYKKGTDIDDLEAIVRQSRNWSDWLDKMTEVING